MHCFMRGDDILITSWLHNVGHILATCTRSKAGSKILLACTRHVMFLEQPPQCLHLEFNAPVSTSRSSFKDSRRERGGGEVACSRLAHCHLDPT